MLLDSFNMVVLLVAMGLFLVVFGTFLVGYVTNFYKNPYKRGVAKKMMVFVVLANLYILIEQIVAVQVSPILPLVNMLNQVFGIFLLAMFCVFMHRNFTAHGDVVKFNTLLVWLTLIFATVALGMGFIDVMMGNTLMQGDVFCVTHCLAILLFSIFGNLMILDFIMNNREPVCAIDMLRGARLTAIGGK